MNILAIGAHPDDIEYGCGGTILKLKKKGHNVIFLLATDGENWAGKNKEVRINEQMNVMKEFNIESIIRFGLKDGHIKTNGDVVAKLDAVIRENDIDIIFSNNHNDSNQDHIELASIVKSSGRLCKNVLLYDTITSTHFTPNVFVDITETIDAKIDMVNLFTTQVEKYREREIELKDLIKCRAKYYGFKNYNKYVEGFIAEKLSLDSFII